jgi:hypothetical protein
MSRDFNPVGIHITAGLGQCANQCLHCQLSSKSLAEFSLDRYVSMVDKFINFRATTGFPVSQWLGYALNFQVDDFANFLGLHRRLVSVVMKILLLGGLPLMDNDQLSGWLSERMALGSESVMASYFGPPQIHDYMNNKNGHFDWEISAQQLAAQIGLINWQKIFLLKTSLPDMDHILDRLDEVDNVAGRMAYLLFYSGLGRRFEEHRLTKEILDSQPQRLKSLYRVEKNMIWQSEGDWLEWVRLNLNSC